MRERFGARDERSMMLRFHTQTGGVTLTAQQPLNNVVRVALQAFAAVCGGTQSLHTNGYDEALALPTEQAAKLALRTQQVIAARVRGHRHRRPVRRLLLRRGADRRDRGPRARADRAGRRARRRGRRDRLHRRRDRRVRVELPGALPHRPGHRRRRQPLRRRRRAPDRETLRVDPDAEADQIDACGHSRPPATRDRSPRALQRAARNRRRAPATCCPRSAKPSAPAPPSAKSAGTMREVFGSHRPGD